MSNIDNILARQKHTVATDALFAFILVIGLMVSVLGLRSTLHAEQSAQPLQAQVETACGDRATC